MSTYFLPCENLLFLEMGILSIFLKTIFQFIFLDTSSIILFFLLNTLASASSFIFIFIFQWMIPFTVMLPLFDTLISGLHEVQE